MARRLAQPAVLALDVGTSSVRAILHDSRGEPSRSARVHLAYRPRMAADGTAEVSAHLLRRLVERCLDTVLEGASDPIAAVGVSTFWHGLLGLDAAGRPSTPVFLWSDSRSWPDAAALRDELDAENVHQRTGCPVHPSYWPAKLAWARRVGIPAERWCSFADHLFQRWFGTLETSLSMASGTGVCRLADGRWDPALLERLALGADRLPELGAEPRPLGRRLKRRWPALADACFLPAAGDGALANLGSGCTTPESRALTVGTSGALRVITDRRPDRLPPGIWCYRLDGRRFVVGGSFSNGGNFHAWALDTLRIKAEEMERALGRIGPGEHGLTFLPLLAGERSPGFALHASGVLAGLTLATKPAEIARAGLEGIALDFAAVDERLDTILPRARLLVGSGAGLLRSPAMVRILADAIGKPVLASRLEEASARGAALLALERLGVEVGTRGDPVGRTVEPDPGARPAYSRLRERHRALYEAVAGGGMAGGPSGEDLHPVRRKRSNGG